MACARQRQAPHSLSYRQRKMRTVDCVTVDLNLIHEGSTRNCCLSNRFHSVRFSRSAEARLAPEPLRCAVGKSGGRPHIVSALGWHVDLLQWSQSKAVYPWARAGQNVTARRLQRVICTGQLPQGCTARLRSVAFSSVPPHWPQWSTYNRNVDAFCYTEPVGLVGTCSYTIDKLMRNNVTWYTIVFVSSIFDNA